MNPLARHSHRRRNRRGFNLVELLTALAISATLLTAVMVALVASFDAYQRTTEVASSHTVARLAMHRILTLIRTGTDFAPLPANPLDRIVESDFVDFRLENGDVLSIEWDEDDETIYIVVGGAGGPRFRLLEGVITQTDGVGDVIMPFTLEYERGYKLYRATLDITVVPDDNQSLEIEGDNGGQILHIVATAMPRSNAYD